MNKLKSMGMRPKFLPVFEMAVDSGIRLGWNRAHKHNENPHIDTIVDSISTEIMNSLYEWFEFEDEHE